MATVRAVVAAAVIAWVLATAAAQETPDPWQERFRQCRAAIEGGRAVKGIADLERLTGDLPERHRALRWRLTPGPEFRSASRVWDVGNVLIMQGRTNLPLAQVDMLTGKRLADIQFSDGANVNWVAPALEPGTVLVSSDKRVALCEQATGKLLRELAGPFDPVFTPIPCPDGFIAARGYRVGSLCRLTWDGQEVWTRSLPDGTLQPPQAMGPCFSAGRAGLLIDVRTGTDFRPDPDNAASLPPDVRYLVSTSLGGSPADVTTTITGRDIRTGAQPWTFNAPGRATALPLLWQAQHLAYVLLPAGHLRCLDARTGKTLWSYFLENDAPDVNFYQYQHQFPPTPMRLAAPYLLVMDAADVLHVLDARTGRRVLLFPLLPPRDPEGRPGWRDRPITAPFLLPGQTLLLPMHLGLTAFNLADPLAGRECLEVQARHLLAQSLIARKNPQSARLQIAELAAIEPGSPRLLAARAALYGPDSPDKDPAREILLRLQLMRAADATEDPRLRELTGLLKRIPIGRSPCTPLLVGRSLYLASAGGRIRKLDADSLAQTAQVDLGLEITGNLTWHDAGGGMLLFSTEARHTMALRPDLTPLFDIPACAHHEYLVLGGSLIRNWPAGPYTQVASFDLAARTFGPMTKIERKPIGETLHAGRIYCRMPGGRTASFDGQTLRVHDAQANFRPDAQHVVNTRSSPPLAFGDGGVYAADEHLRPTRLLLASPRPVLAAAANNGSFVAVMPSAERAVRSARSLAAARPWTLVARSLDGQTTLPLSCPVSLANTTLDYRPSLVPLAEGFLLSDAELVYVRPDRPDALWRFIAPIINPGHFYLPVSVFRPPLIDANRLLAAETVSGDLYVFDLDRVTKGAGGP